MPPDDTRHATGAPAGDADAVVTADRYREVCRAIVRLQVRQREVIALHCLAGYEISEVAEMLEISPATVRVHLHVGRQRLVKIMAGGGGIRLMAESDGARTPPGQKRWLLLVLRESGDALEAASKLFDGAAGAARLHEVARAKGLLRADKVPENNPAITDASLEEEAPPFDLEAGATRLWAAARARGLLSTGATDDPGPPASRIPERGQEIQRWVVPAESRVLSGQHRPLENPSVVALVARAVDSDQDAWKEIVERYAPLVWSICTRYRLKDQDIEDVGQAVWLLLVEHLGKLRDPAALRGWLATTTHRECQRALTAARRTEGAGTKAG